MGVVVSNFHLAKITAEEKVKLTSGKDFWTSEHLADKGIPSFRMSDGPHGLRYQALAADHLGINDSVPSTSFPTASASAAAWDPDLIQAMGKAIGLEAQSLGVDMVLGPGVNMKRNPLCGRNFEYFSEDPFLAGKLGAAWINGIQSQGIAACLKHFAANNQEMTGFHLIRWWIRPPCMKSILRLFVLLSQKATQKRSCVLTTK